MSEMNWVDETQCSEKVDAFAERSVSIDVSMNSTVDYGYMGLSVTADGVDDLPAAIKMIQAALDAAPAEFTASPDESAPMPPPVDFD
jgi:hypothetical protein